MVFVLHDKLKIVQNLFVTDIHIYIRYTKMKALSFIQQINMYVKINDDRIRIILAQFMTLIKNGRKSFKSNLGWYRLSTHHANNASMICTNKNNATAMFLQWSCYNFHLPKRWPPYWQHSHRLRFLPYDGDVSFDTIQ